MHILQRTLDGKWVAANKYTADQLLAMTSHMDGVSSSEKVKVAWLQAPQVHAFLRNACDIMAFEEMVSEYRNHLDDMQTFETLCRRCRNGSESEATPTQRQAAKPPWWYDAYLKTTWWNDLRQSAIGYYRGCVMCGDDQKQECHHRHYRTLGCESITDVSIFCSKHHEQIQPMLGICVPRMCPESVRKLLH